MPTYYDYFNDARNNAMRSRQLNELAAHRLANERLAQERVEEMMRAHAANELLREVGQKIQLQRYMGAQAQQQTDDAEANRIANTINPPAAEAVTTDPSDPNNVAWTNRANALRGQYFAQHPNEQPGPPVPYTGGAKRFASVEKYLAPAKPSNRPAPGTAVANTADAAARSVAESAFAPYGLGYADLTNPQTKFEYMSSNDPKTAVGAGDNGQPAPFVRVTAPGKNPVFVDADKAYKPWVKAQTAAMARKSQIGGGQPATPSPEPYLASPPRDTTPVAPATAVPDDQKSQARAWAEANPNDPRAQQILNLVQ